MPEPLKIAVAGLGRMGAIHALHAYELARETQACELAALADLDTELARRVAADIGCEVPIFSSVENLARAEVCNATVIVTPTENHRPHAALMIECGHRVLLEKPLTGAVESDREFAAELDRYHPQALMLAFQRRFDAPLRYAKELASSGVIGRVFKIYSALEDSTPAPNGYKSGGILPDMSIHNVDEVLWLSGGGTPHAAAVIGARLYSHRLTTCHEDFDDALLYIWFEDELVAQIQVSRNHVSGYRNEAVLFGEEGQIHVGHFEQRPFEVLVEAYGRRGRSEPIARREFNMRDYGRPLPEFADRFGPAYKAELAAFIECCRSDSPFPSTHRDALRAQEVISAAMQAVITPEEAARIHIPHTMAAS